MFCPTCKTLMKMKGNIWVCPQCNSLPLETRVNKQSKDSPLIIDEEQKLYNLINTNKVKKIDDYFLIFTKNARDIINEDVDILDYVKTVCQDKSKQVCFVDIRYIINNANITSVDLLKKDTQEYLDCPPSCSGPCHFMWDKKSFNRQHFQYDKKIARKVRISTK